VSHIFYRVAFVETVLVEAHRLPGLGTRIRRSNTPIRTVWPLAGQPLTCLLTKLRQACPAIVPAYVTGLPISPNTGRRSTSGQQ